LDPKKDLLTVLAYAGLSVLFAAICVAVWATGGHHVFVKHKLRIGALMLTLAGTATTGCPVVNCYDYSPPDDDSADDYHNLMAIDGYVNGDMIEMDLSAGNTLTGTITSPVGQVFAFGVLDSSDVVQVAAIESIDGAIDQEVEAFEIAIDPGLASGTYTLVLADVEEAHVADVEPAATYQLVITGVDMT